MRSASDPSPPGRLVQAGVLTLTVVVFAAVVATVTLQLREGLREQILRREAETLAAVASMQLENDTDEMGIFITVLRVSRLPGVEAVRFFDANRGFSAAWPVPWSEEPPGDDDWRAVTAGRSFARLHPKLSSEDLLGPLGTPERGLLEAWVPLRRSDSAEAIGAAQFWMESAASARDLAEHDRRLWMQAAFAWVVGSLVIGLAFRWALQRLAVTNRALRARSEDLMRANRELVLAAKTSALGTVTAHLMHELKNPLAGLEVIMAGQGESGPRSDATMGGELAAASELTRRLRTMVNDVVGVLRDEQTSAEFELTCADVAEIVGAKLQGEAKQRDLRLEASGAADVVIAGRRANLATLVLRNLVQNALEATAPGGVVRLRGARDAKGAVEFLVEDAGAGLPAAVRSRLFQPCASTKVGGSGLGLALSQQLAQQAGGRLELVRSDAQGTCFRLVLSAEA